METPQIPKSSMLTPKSIGIFLAGILLMGVLVFTALFRSNTNSKSSNNNSNTSPDSTSKIGNLAPKTIVYGSWRGENSVILAYDLQTGKNGVIATLPSNIKKVSVLSADSLLYISNTDARDHGTEIVKYNITTKQTTPVLTASSGYVIDDYMLSPNKQYIATWEIQPNLQSGILLNGKSRVYTAKLDNQQKNLIYNEDATLHNPVRYPRAILDNGTVFMDRFLPNSSAGWAYGMSVSNFNGTQRQDIPSMINGTYGTQPIMSPNGSSLLFAGYNGAFGPGDAVKNGFRQALLTPNTIELLDTTTLQRKTLANLSANAYYPYLAWDSDTSLVYYTLDQSRDLNGLYTFDLNTQQKAKIPSNTSRYFVSSVSDSLLLLGDKNTSSSALGNLGSTYESQYTKLTLLNSKSQIATDLSLDSILIQMIAVLPSHYFADSSYESPGPIVGSNNGNNLQLGQMVLKTQLEDTREEEQQDPVVTEPPTPTIAPTRTQSKTPQDRPHSDPKPTSAPKEDTIDCQSMAREMCEQQYPDDINAKGYCIDSTKPQLKQSGQCNASPLYLYSNKDISVDISIYTPISQENFSHSQGSFTASVQKNGTFYVQNQMLNSAKFDYISAIRKITPPQRGMVIAKKDIEKSLRFFASQLGLNTQETTDLIRSGKSKITAPYAFISFFDHATSHVILPITFNPQPDVYRNIVFYFKNLEKPLNYTPELPKFEKIKRQGFTAVEISELVE